MTFEAYLARFAAARLVSWWRALAWRWDTDTQIAVGSVRLALRGDAPSRKLAGLCERKLTALREQMLGGAE